MDDSRKCGSQENLPVSRSSNSKIRDMRKMRRKLWMAKCFVDDAWKWNCRTDVLDGLKDDLPRIYLDVQHLSKFAIAMMNPEAMLAVPIIGVATIVEDVVVPEAVLATECQFEEMITSLRVVRIGADPDHPSLAETKTDRVDFMLVMVMDLRWTMDAPKKAISCWGKYGKLFFENMQFLSYKKTSALIA